jgi:1D-myo-inositol 3-kinase
MQRDPVEILVVGHYCHDTLVKHNGVHRALGGSSAYGSAVLSAIGADFAVVAKVGPDFLYHNDVLASPNVVDGQRTTNFVNDYTAGERKQRLESVCEPIRPEELEMRAEVAIACPIAGEVPLTTLRRMRVLSRVLLADVQGFIRAFKPSGEVYDRRLAETPFADAVESLNYFKASTEEARALDIEALRQKTRVVVTEGSRGCTLYSEHPPLPVPGFAVEEVDSTGAGDCFLAGLAVGLLRQWDVLRALRLANFCGAQAVTQIGIPALRREIFKDLVD